MGSDRRLFVAALLIPGFLFGPTPAYGLREQQKTEGATAGMEEIKTLLASAAPLPDPPAASPVAAGRYARQALRRINDQLRLSEDQIQRAKWISHREHVEDLKVGGSLVSVEGPTEWVIEKIAPRTRRLWASVVVNPHTRVKAGPYPFAGDFETLRGYIYVPPPANPPAPAPVTAVPSPRPATSGIEGSTAGLEESPQEAASRQFIRRYLAILPVAKDPQGRRAAIQELVAVSEQISLAGRTLPGMGPGYIRLDLPPQLPEVPSREVIGLRPTQVLYDKRSGELYTYTVWGKGPSERTGLNPVFLSRSPRLIELRERPAAGEPDLYGKILSGELVLLVPKAAPAAGLEERRPTNKEAEVGAGRESVSAPEAGLVARLRGQVEIFEAGLQGAPPRAIERAEPPLSRLKEILYVSAQPVLSRDFLRGLLGAVHSVDDAVRRFKFESETQRQELLRPLNLMTVEITLQLSRGPLATGLEETTITQQTNLESLLAPGDFLTSPAGEEYQFESMERIYGEGLSVRLESVTPEGSGEPVLFGPELRGFRHRPGPALRVPKASSEPVWFPVREGHQLLAFLDKGNNGKVTYYKQQLPTFPYGVIEKQGLAVIKRSVPGESFNAYYLPEAPKNFFVISPNRTVSYYHVAAASPADRSNFLALRDKLRRGKPEDLLPANEAEGLKGGLEEVRLSRRYLTGFKELADSSDFRQFLNEAGTSPELVKGIVQPAEEALQAGDLGRFRAEINRALTSLKTLGLVSYAREPLDHFLELAGNEVHPAGQEEGRGAATESPAALSIEEVARQNLRQLAEKWGLVGLSAIQLAAVTPEIISGDPSLKGLVGRPVSLGDATLLVVSEDSGAMSRLLDSLKDRGKPVTVRGFGAESDPVLKQFEQAARDRGFTVEERVVPQSRDFVAFLRQLLANLAGLRATPVDEADLILLRIALSVLA
ncbi:MAG: hypothetical protein HYZ93_05520 [Candidatus Omnitrophica bacterium]|nr:hypothetical protein [Candidatus Omnitrophota bacterium]